MTASEPVGAADRVGPGQGRAPRLDSLTGMRFVAAFMVFLFHVGAGFLAPVTGQGRLGVSFFFMLSGLLLTWSHRDGDRPLRFYRRRLARIYPAYLVALVLGLLVTVLTGVGPAGIKAGIASVFLLQAWFPNSDINYVWNGVGWSLSAEAFFYLVFPFIVKAVVGLSRRRRRVLQASMVGVIVLNGAMASVLMPANGLPNTVAAWFVYTFPLIRLAEFVLGMTLAADVRETRIPISRPVCLLLFVGAYLLAGLDPTGFGLVSITIVPFALVMVRYAQADVARDTSLFRARWLVTLGVWSYAFYLVHQLVVRLTVWAFGPSIPDLTYGLLVLPMLAVALLLAYLLHHFVEKPADSALNGRSGRSVINER